MRESRVLQQNDLDALLELFSNDREEAGKVYEALRKGLIRYFTSKGCSNPPDLADETLTRVAAKATTFDPSLDVKPSSYAYGFASRVFLEYSRDPTRRSIEFDSATHSGTVRFDESEESEDAMDCLDECLAKYTAGERSMIVRYYAKDKQEKIELRKQISEELGFSMGVLHMRVHRMRATLKTCVSRCLAKRG